MFHSLLLLLPDWKIIYYFRKRCRAKHSLIYLDEHIDLESLPSTHNVTEHLIVDWWAWKSQLLAALPTLWRPPLQNFRPRIVGCPATQHGVWWMSRETSSGSRRPTWVTNWELKRVGEVFNSNFFHSPITSLRWFSILIFIRA